MSPRTLLARERHTAFLGARISETETSRAVVWLRGASNRRQCALQVQSAAVASSRCSTAASKCCEFLNSNSLTRLQLKAAPYLKVASKCQKTLAGTQFGSSKPNVHSPLSLGIFNCCQCSFSNANECTRAVLCPLWSHNEHTDAQDLQTKNYFASA